MHKAVHAIMSSAIPNPTNCPVGSGRFRGKITVSSVEPNMIPTAGIKSAKPTFALYFVIGNKIPNFAKRFSHTIRNFPQSRL